MKSLGVLEHGHGVSPSILNYIIVDYFFQSLDLELIIFCASHLNKTGSIHAFVCLFVCFCFCYREFRPFTLKLKTHKK